MTPPAILTRLSNLSVALSIEGGQVRARMDKPGRPIPQEARELIRQVKPHLLDLMGPDWCPACDRLEAACERHHLTGRPAGG